MADISTKTVGASAEKAGSESPSVASGSPPEPAQPTGSAPALLGWKYRTRKIGPVILPHYASPKAQLLLVAFVCFLCPGMFNALNGLGGGGQLNPDASNDSNTALNATFAVVGFFAGTVVNSIGIRWALSFGGLGYCVYVSAYLCYNYTQSYGYIVFAGVLLGMCAGILWSAQGAIMMSYPSEEEKGRFISWFWMIFNMGGVIGSLVPLGQNFHTKSDSTVSSGTYVGFLVLTALGGALAWTLVNANAVVRNDGSKVVLMKHPTWKSEILGLYETLRDDPWVMLLFPMFFASNWFYTYHFNDVNLAHFNTRTRALNNVLYWTAQIFGALAFGAIQDMKYFRRTQRAVIVWTSLFAITFAIWGGGYAFQKGYTRDNITILDWTSDGYVGPMFLYIFYGFYDAAWQTSVYWFMGAMSNNSRKLANLAGFYKGLQSAGAAIIASIDRRRIPYMNEFASCWGLLAGSLVIALPVMIMRIRDTVTIEEDLKFSDETVEDVLAPVEPISINVRADSEKV